MRHLIVDRSKNFLKIEDLMISKCRLFITDFLVSWFLIFWWPSMTLGDLRWTWKFSDKIQWLTMTFNDLRAPWNTLNFFVDLWWPSNGPKIPWFLGIDGSNKSAASKCLGLRDGKWKFFDTNPPLLYDLENDLSEKFDLYESHTALANRMKQKLDKMVDQINKRNEKSENGKLKKCWNAFCTAIQRSVDSTVCVLSLSCLSLFVSILSADLCCHIWKCI